MNILRCLKIKSFTFEDSVKYYIKIDFHEKEIPETFFEKYREALDFIKRKNITLLFEKIFSPLSFHEKFIQKREVLFKEMALEEAPLSFVEGKSVHQSVAGVLFCGVICLSDKVTVNYVKINGKVIGAVQECPDSRYLYLYGLRAESTDSSRHNEFQFKKLFQKIGHVIMENNFKPQDILRTWIYLKDINSHYGDFNRARREYFEENKIHYSADDNDLPASTCIGGDSPDSNITINLVCADKTRVLPQIKRIYNRYQNEAEGDAYLFRPTFSRALLVDQRGYSELQVSGTASINEKGETVFIDQPYEQIKKTLLNVSALLDQAGHDFSDFCESTCFFKKPEYYLDFLEVVKELNIEHFYSTYVISDVCRADLLFEFDGVSIKNKLK